MGAAVASMKIEGWEKNLLIYAKQSKKIVFEWGKNDCILWSSKWVYVATGVDYFTQYVETYSTKEEAYLKLKEIGFDSTQDLISAHLQDVPVMMAQRGDLLLNKQDVVGICTGITGMFLTEKGITAFDTLTCVKAWRVE